MTEITERTGTEGHLDLTEDLLRSIHQRLAAIERILTSFAVLVGLTIMGGILFAMFSNFNNGLGCIFGIALLVVPAVAVTAFVIPRK